MRTVESADVGTVSRLDTVRSVLGDHPVRLAILFGSHARGDATQHSDLDVAVELDDLRPGDEGYNEAFFGLGAALSESLHTDDIDVVDVHSVSPSLARTLLDDGVLLVGDQDRAQRLLGQKLDAREDQRSPRERLDDAIRSIDEHLA